MQPQWVVERVTTGVLQYDIVDDDTPEEAPPTWRFSTHTVLRARRIAELERIFDADPQLAAMTADLLEEVRQLRRRLKG
ncbi:MAG: MerR family transcriptional regulator [Comamonas sp.]